jgi:uncharacterized membrane protein
VKDKLSSGKIVALALLAIVLTAALALALTDLVRKVLAEPITRLFYFIGLLLKSTPQVIFWGMVLLFLLIVAGKSVEQVHKHEPAEFNTPLPSPRRGRIAAWASHIHLALRGDHYARSRLAEFLAGLLMELLAQEERVSPTEIRKRLELGELDLPPEIQNYLKARFAMGTISQPGFWAMISAKIAHFWEPFLGKNNLEASALPDRLTRQELEKIILFLEDRLEVKHGD